MKKIRRIAAYLLRGKRPRHHSGRVARRLPAPSRGGRY
jgi:hypothetical protein